MAEIRDYLIYRRILNFIYHNWGVITVALFLIILVLSLYPNNQSLEVSGTTDKIFHLIAYLSLSFLVALRKPFTYILIFIYLISFGISIELVQPYFHRSFEFLDILANTVGIIMGIFFAYVIKKYYS